MTARRTLYRLSIAAATMLMASVAAPIAPASADGPKRYPAGYVTAGKPGWDTATSSKKFNCVYFQWPRVKVNWECKLKVQGATTYVRTYSGSFNTGSHNTPTYYYPAAHDGVYCAVAYAVNFDGTGSASHERCG